MKNGQQASLFFFWGGGVRGEDGNKLFKTRFTLGRIFRGSMCWYHGFVLPFTQR